MLTNLIARALLFKDSFTEVDESTGLTMFELDVLKAQARILKSKEEKELKNSVRREARKAFLAEFNKKEEEGK